MAWQNSSPPSGKSEGKRQEGVDIGRFSMIPRMFFGSGTAATLGRPAMILFFALCEHANRNSGNSFKASDKALAADTGLGPRTICDGRKQLEERGLISCIRDAGESHFYTLPVYSFDWVKVEDRLRPKLKPRANHAKRIKVP
jgi:hypothetical protein